MHEDSSPQFSLSLSLSLPLPFSLIPWSGGEKRSSFYSGVDRDWPSGETTQTRGKGIKVTNASRKSAMLLGSSQPSDQSWCIFRAPLCSSPALQLGFSFGSLLLYPTPTPLVTVPCRHLYRITKRPPGGYLKSFAEEGIRAESESPLPILHLLSYRRFLMLGSLRLF